MPNVLSGHGLSSDRPENIRSHVLPSDPERSRFRFIIVAGKRARQIQAGAIPHILSSSRRAERVAMEECSRGLIKYHEPDQTLGPLSPPVVVVPQPHNRRPR